MKERLESKDREIAFLKAESAKNPDLFKAETFVDSPSFLAPFGIIVPGKEEFPLGYLKLRPEDFIVEEILPSGGVATVEAPVAASPTIAEGEGETIYATLVKCGLSTIEAVEDLSRMLGVPLQQIGYAGIKDKNAITAQRISLRGVAPEAILAVRSPYFFLKDFARGKGVVEKGKLSGNRFTITMRSENLRATVAPGVMEGRLQNLLDHGFYNYYYLQRFGSPRYINYMWGIMLLHEQWREVVWSVLVEPSARELPYIIEIRKKISEIGPDWQQIKTLIAPFPHILTHENKIVDQLLLNPEDFRGALLKLPEQLLLWVYGFASWAFNQRLADYAKEGSRPPEKFALPLSNDPRDYEPYKAMLGAFGLYPLRSNLPRSLPTLRFMHREASTMEKVFEVKYGTHDEGAVVQFSLGKGQYATTFLSHLFNLVGGKIPEHYSRDFIDGKEVLGTGSTGAVRTHFADVIKAQENSSLESEAE